MSKEFMSTGGVAELLGIRMHNLVYLVSCGRIREPKLRLGGKRAWSRKEIDEARKIIDARRKQAEMGR